MVNTLLTLMFLVHVSSSWPDSGFSDFCSTGMFCLLVEHIITGKKKKKKKKNPIQPSFYLWVILKLPL